MQVAHKFSYDLIKRSTHCHCLAVVAKSFHYPSLRARSASKAQRNYKMDGIELCVRENRERASELRSNEERNRKEKREPKNQDQERRSSESSKSKMHRPKNSKEQSTRCQREKGTESTSNDELHRKAIARTQSKINSRTERAGTRMNAIKGTQVRRGETLRMRRAHFQGCRSRPRVHSRPRVPYVQGCKGNTRRQVLRITEILKESVGDKSHHQTCMRQRTKGIQVERSPTSTKFQRNMLETTHTYGRNSNTKAPLQGCVRMPSAV